MYVLSVYKGVLSFLELDAFAAVRDRYLDDDEFLALQHYLLGQPEAGEVIPGSGGCRKLRWGLEGRGKRGGLRVIYFLRLVSGQIVLVTLYAKNVRDNIDPGLLRRLKEGVERG